jgi:hypothetical protein
MKKFPVAERQPGILGYYYFNNQFINAQILISS